MKKKAAKSKYFWICKIVLLNKMKKYLWWYCLAIKSRIWRKMGVWDLSLLFNLMPIIRDLEQREILRLHTGTRNVKSVRPEQYIKIHKENDAGSFNGRKNEKKIKIKKSRYTHMPDAFPSLMECYTYLFLFSNIAINQYKQINS